MKKLFITVLTLVGLMALAVPAFAQAGGATEGRGLIALAAALCMGVAAFGGTFGQSRAAVAALEGIARNPQAAPRVQTPMILGLALIESLVLFSFAIAFLIQGKI